MIPLRNFLNTQPSLATEEAAILLLYPLTCALGQLVYLTGPTASYFANKRNIFNILLVKNGWFWTTLASLALLAYKLGLTKSVEVIRDDNGNSEGQYRDVDNNENEENGNDENEGNSDESSVNNAPAGVTVKVEHIGAVRPFLIRYAIATAGFFLFTQWCFGLPLMDKIFVWTGGSCLDTPGHSHVPSSSKCRVAGGNWSGGFDPSGHAFLLTLSSLYLWFELLPLMRQEKRFPLLFKLVLGLLVLWWWMFLMTCVYFHSFAEKLGGMLPAYFVCLLYLR